MRQIEVSRTLVFTAPRHRKTFCVSVLGVGTSP